MTKLNRRITKKRIIDERLLIMFTLDNKVNENDYNFEVEYEGNVLQLDYIKTANSFNQLRNGDNVTLFLVNKYDGELEPFNFIVTNVTNIIVTKSNYNMLPMFAANGINFTLFPVMTMSEMRQMQGIEKEPADIIPFKKK